MIVFQDFGMCNMKLPQKRRFQVTETTETLTQSQYFKAFKLPLVIGCADTILRHRNKQM